MNIRENVFKLLSSYTDEQLEEIVNVYKLKSFAYSSFIEQFVEDFAKVNPSIQKALFEIQLVSIYPYLADYLWCKFNKK